MKVNFFKCGIAVCNNDVTRECSFYVKQSKSFADLLHLYSLNVNFSVGDVSKAVHSNFADVCCLRL